MTFGLVLHSDLGCTLSIQYWAKFDTLRDSFSKTLMTSYVLDTDCSFSGSISAASADGVAHREVESNKHTGS